MKRFALIALAFVALLEVGLVFQGEAQQVGSTGSSIYFPPPTATRAWFRAMLGDTIRAWHNYDVFFKATPPAATADGARMFNYTTTIATDPTTSSAEWTGLYSTMTYTAGTNGAFTLNGIEGVARPNSASLGGTYIGGKFRTYASGANYKVTSMIGSVNSVRSVDPWNPKYGTACVGAQIWMAIHPATAAMGQDSINNYHGLWIYDENTAGLATTNAIKIGTAGARFKYDLALQDGQTITDTTGGTQFNKPIKVDTIKVKVVSVAKDTSCEIASFNRTAIADTATNMVGSDSLTCAYIITPFATRAAITIPPSVSGVAASTNLLIIRRPAADTAAYDRYSIVKIRQR